MAPRTLALALPAAGLANAPACPSDLASNTSSEACPAVESAVLLHEFLRWPRHFSCPELPALRAPRHPAQPRTPLRRHPAAAFRQLRLAPSPVQAWGCDSHPASQSRDPSCKEFWWQPCLALPWRGGRPAVRVLKREAFGEIAKLFVLCRAGHPGLALRATSSVNPPPHRPASTRQRCTRLWCSSVRSFRMPTSSQTMSSPATCLHALLRRSSWQSGEVTICRKQQVTCQATGKQVILRTQHPKVLSNAIGHSQFRSLQELGVQEPGMG